jgi:hypothetical protein
MTHMEQLIERLKKQQNNRIDFYTPTGLHIYFKDEMLDDSIDVESAVSRLESMLPRHLSSCIEMIIFGDFEEFHERSINAFYDSGTVYVSNLQDDENDILDDLIHELSHAIEEQYGYQIYGDQKLKDEFLRKRMHLYKILWEMGFKAPKVFFQNTEYDQEFDDFLHQKVGYDTLGNAMRGLFITPYAATSLREYFATGFTDFFTQSDHKFLKTVSPALYDKIIFLQKEENLDF